ncbi:hypothetical protein [Paenibacillus hamazuiensis]|uniref:hypothetical protein n=1 Tax=Paenibacillus hamazuiensis TaxID=2936508 RepID=UPI00200CF341|nr:hypothetical protein [Paenibacillus hamazuiensis]
MKSKVVKINDLFINEENPRDEPQENEAAAVKILFKKGSEQKLLNLMKSIAQYGFEISERIIVVEHEAPNKYLVMDGNRRITCIKLLNNPDFLPLDIDKRESLIKRINKIKKDFDYTPIASVDCVVYDIPAEEDQMKRTIQNKHIGQNKGVGRLQWDYKAQNRFTNNDYKIYLVNYLDNLLKVERSLSTMERIFGDPDLRSHLGIVIDKKIPEIILESAESEKKILYILQLLKDKKITVSDVYYKVDRENFYQTYFIDSEEWKNSNPDESSDPEVLTPENIDESSNEPRTKSSEVTEETAAAKEHGSKEELTPTDSNEMKEEQGSVSGPGANGPENAKDNSRSEEELQEEDVATINASTQSQPDPQDNIKQQKPENISFLFQGIIYKGNHPGIKRALFELHRTRVSTYTLSATYLTRTLLECTLQEYLIKNNLFSLWRNPAKDPSLTDLLNYCVTNGTFQGINQNYQRTINMAHAKKDHDELNSVTHGKYNLPSTDALWDIERRWRIIMKYMVENLNNNP